MYITTMDDNINWMKLTHLLSIFPLNLRVPLLYINLNFKILHTFLKLYALENNYASPLRVLCTLMPQTIPFLTLCLLTCGMKSPSHGGVQTQYN